MPSQRFLPLNQHKPITMLFFFFLPGKPITMVYSTCPHVQPHRIRLVVSGISDGFAGSRVEADKDLSRSCGSSAFVGRAAFTGSALAGGTQRCPRSSGRLDHRSAAAVIGSVFVHGGIRAVCYVSFVHIGSAITSSQVVLLVASPLEQITPSQQTGHTPGPSRLEN